jgi:hypothetical protein
MYSISGSTSISPKTIKVTFVGANTVRAGTMTVCSSSPILELARQLLAAGYDPATPLEVHRGDILALCVRSIGEAASLEINGHGNGFRRHRTARAAASPIHQKAPAHGGEALHREIRAE